MRIFPDTVLSVPGQPDAIPLTAELRHAVWEARKLANLSVRELARAVGRSPTWLNRIERESYDERADKTITARELRLVAAMTDRPLDFFLSPEEIANLPDPEADMRLASLEREVHDLRIALAAVAALVSLEGLEESQRLFLEGWLRRTPSTSAKGVDEKANQGEV